MRNGEFLSKDILKAEIGLFAQNTPPALTVKEAIGDIVDNLGKIQDHTTKKTRPDELKIIQKIGLGQKLCNVRFSDTSVYTWQIPEVFGNVSEKEIKILETIAKNRRKKIYGNIPNGNPLSIEIISRLSNLSIQKDEIDILINKKYIKEVDGKFDIMGAMFCSGLYKRPLWTEPSPTIITIFHSPRYMLHPSENRPLTIRECARLQSFPDNFHFLESGISIEDSYRLIGNAVTPYLEEIRDSDIFHKTITNIKEAINLLGSLNNEFTTKDAESVKYIVDALINGLRNKNSEDRRALVISFFNNREN